MMWIALKGKQHMNWTYYDSMGLHKWSLIYAKVYTGKSQSLLLQKNKDHASCLFLFFLNFLLNLGFSAIRSGFWEWAHIYSLNPLEVNGFVRPIPIRTRINPSGVGWAASNFYSLGSTVDDAYLPNRCYNCNLPFWLWCKGLFFSHRFENIYEADLDRPSAHGYPVIWRFCIYKLEKVEWWIEDPQDCCMSMTFSMKWE